MNKERRIAKDLVDSYLDGGMNRRDMLRKAGALGLSVPVLTAALGARGAVGQDASPAASPAEDEAIELGNYEGQTLQMSIAMAESEVAVFNELIVDGFREATGGEIEVANIEATDVVRTLESQVGSDNVQIDMLVQDNNTLAPLVDGELVEPIEDAESIMPGATFEALKEVLQFDGTYYFLPSRPNVQITYYNSARFEQYGISEPPATWEDVLAAGQTIVDNAGVGQISVQGDAGGPAGVTVTQFIWQAGGDPLEINNEAACGSIPVHAGSEAIPHAAVPNCLVRYNQHLPAQ